MGLITNNFARIVIACVRGYQWCISPWMGDNCRYYPTCSQYTIDAMIRYGFLKGIFFSVKRILRCHPWHKGGYDPLL